MAGITGTEFKPLLGLANQRQLILRMNPEEFVRAVRACDEFKKEMEMLRKDAVNIAEEEHFHLGEKDLLACDGMVWNLRAFAEETRDKFAKHAQNGHDAKGLLETIRATTLSKDQDWAAGYQKLMQEK